MTLEQSRPCSVIDCGKLHCLCGCQGKPGPCARCSKHLCPDCNEEAHRVYRGICADCRNPPPDDSDIEDYDPSGDKPGPFGPSFFRVSNSARMRQNLVRKKGPL